MMRWKSALVAERSLTEFCQKHDDVWFLTFTQPGLCLETQMVGGEFLEFVGPYKCVDKDEMEYRAKPLRDLWDSRGVDYLFVWECKRRKDGQDAWHLHVLVASYQDVDGLREFMVRRGWGRIMYFERVKLKTTSGGREERWELPEDKLRGMVSYLVKYLRKGSVRAAASQHRKVFGGPKRCKHSTIANLRWDPHEHHAGSYLYGEGKGLFIVLTGRLPRWKDIAFVIRLGVELTGWADFDPWWETWLPFFSSA